MNKYVALFVSGKRDFFKEKTCINCSVEEFCACEGADVLFDVEEVMRQRIINLGQGVKISEPIKVKRTLATRNYIYASLSHNGILAICANKKIIQFTDLNNDLQVEVGIECDTLVAFYDEMALLLTEGSPLREATVISVFENPRIAIFRIIEGTSDAYPFTDVSLLNERRELFYRTRDCKLFSFNVDTRENTEVDVGKWVLSIAFSTGINSGVKAVFWSNSDMCTYALNNDNTLTKVDGRQYHTIIGIFPLASNPNNITDAVFKYGCPLMKNGKKIALKRLIGFDSLYSIVRVFRDVFLAYDKITKSWVVFRLITP